MCNFPNLLNDSECDVTLLSFYLERRSAVWDRSVQLIWHNQMKDFKQKKENEKEEMFHVELMQGCG